MNKPKFLGGCSTEALKQLVDPAFSRDLNSPLSEYVMRSIGFELLMRGEKIDIEDPIIRRAIVGPDRCKHDRSIMGTCAACSQEESLLVRLHKLADDFRKEAGRSSTLVRSADLTSAAEKIEKLLRSVIEGDVLDEEADLEERPLCFKHGCLRQSVTWELEVGEGAEAFPNALCRKHARKPDTPGTHSEPTEIEV